MNPTSKAGEPKAAPTQSLRSFATHVELAPRLVAPPTAYDVAPHYLLEGYRAAAPAVTTALRQVSNPDYDAIATRDVRKDARVALQLVAPIGLGIVRSFLIGKSLVLFAANPVMLVLGGPALLMTGRKVLDDLRRAFVVDPAIRNHVQLAHAAQQRDDLFAAEQHFKDALAVDVDPQNPRNGDLYLHQGLLYIQAGRPRQALVALAKASVLFGEREGLTQTDRDGAQVKLSKRGWAELLAMACIDSFSKDDKGLDEWTEVARDFGASAMTRFQRFADAKENGHLFGLFGVDERSAVVNRSLVAKVKFFQAKLESRRALTSAARGARLTPALEEGLRLLLGDSSLDDGEKSTALLEQAQFYFQATSRGGRVDLAMLDVALDLVDRAGDLLSRTDPKGAVFMRAEAIAFALQALPRAVQLGILVEPGRRAALAARLAGLRDDARAASGIDGADVFMVWAEEQLFRLADTAAERRAAAERGVRAARELGDPVAELHAALRLAFADRTPGSIADISRAADAMVHHRDRVIGAFGAKYAAEFVPADDASRATAFATAGERFVAAAEHARALKLPVPFLVQGHAILHDWREASVVLQSVGASCFLRGGNAAAALRLLDSAESTAGAMDSPEAIAIIEALRAGALASTGDQRRANELLDRALGRVPPEARDTYTHWARNVARVSAGEVGSTGPSGMSAVAPKPESRGLDAFHARRSELLEIAEKSRVLLGEAGRPEDLASIQEHAERLTANRFHLAVVGEFSTGKSTFINAVLGDKILPSAVRPTTAAVNRISYAEDAGATVRFRDGTEQEIPLDGIADYITEKKNPGNQKEVVGVDIRHPTSLLASGFTILDTPGLRSLFESHSETTYATIPLCDAVVLLTSATMAYSATEQEFLQRLKEQLGGKVFLVVNKIDQLNPADAARVLEFVRSNAGAVLPGIRVYGVSAYWALVARRIASGRVDAVTFAEDANTGGLTDPAALAEGSRFPAFEEDLFAFLSCNKGALLLESTARAIETPLAELRRATIAEVAALDTSVADVREKARMLLSAARDKRAHIESVFSDATAQLEGIEATFLEQVRTERGNLQTLLLARIDELTPEQLSSHDLAGELKRHLEDWAGSLTSTLSADCWRVLEDVASSLEVVAQELSRVYDSSFRATASVLAPCISIGSLQVPTNQGTIEAVIGGVAGVAAFIVGPVVAIAAATGASFLAAKLRENEAAREKERFKSTVLAALTQVTATIQSGVRERVGELRRGAMSRLREQAEVVVSRYERNAESIVRQREAAESAAADTRGALRARLSRLGELLRTVEGQGDS
jgi:tetratricopeptide (TPR) repeat protein/signal recognition particle receptor subunit beta